MSSSILRYKVAAFSSEWENIYEDLGFRFGNLSNFIYLAGIWLFEDFDLASGWILTGFAVFGGVFCLVLKKD